MALDALPCEYLFTVTAHTREKEPVLIPDGPNGTRVIVTAMSGTFEGPRLRGVVADAAGGDWVLVRASGALRLDVRLVLRTDDGAAILMTYSGFGQRQADGSAILRTAPQFETGDPRYSWLNDIQAAAHGVSAGGSVTYDVYALT